MIQGLRLLELKACGSNISDQDYAKIMKIFGQETITLYQAKKFMKRKVPIKAISVDMCVNSCIAFTLDFSNLTNCPICNESRFYSEQNQKKSRKVACYFPLIQRFKLQFGHYERAQLLRYRSTYQRIPGIYQDIFDGTLYQQHLSNGLFSDSRDIILIGSLDGYQLFRQKRDDCWVIMFINCNLAPDIRVKKQNLLIGAIIPGPKSPNNMNSFFAPIINKLKKLEGMYKSLYK